MGIASLVLGIIAGIASFVPFCGVIAFIPAIIGLILGIVYVVKQSKANEKKGIGIAGIILSALAIIITIFSTIFWGALFGLASESYMYNTYDSYTYDYYDY